MGINGGLKKWLGIFLLIQGIFLFLRWLTSGCEYMQLKRIHHLANLEFFMTLASRFIYRRVTALVRPWGSRLEDVVKSGLVLLLAAAQSCFASHFWLQGEEPHWLSIFVMVSAAVFVHLTAFLLGFSVLERFVRLIYSPPTEDAEADADGASKESRGPLATLFLSTKLHTAIAVFASVSLTILGFHAMSMPPVVYPMEIRMRNLPKDLDGFRIALLTDIHVGPTVGASRVAQVVAAVNKLNPDIVAISGDLVDGSLAHLKNAIQPLAGLKSRHGTVFSTGNHEYYHGDPNEWLRYLGKVNVKPLHNSHLEIRSPSSSSVLCFGGVDDVSSGASGVPGHGMDIKEALNGCPQKAPKVLLVHQPNGIAKLLETSEGQSVDLFLAGHTHGGQFYILIPFAYLTNSFYLGLYQLPSLAQVYVSAGVHFWGPPVKMYGFSEITHITLRA